MSGQTRHRYLAVVSAAILGAIGAVGILGAARAADPTTDQILSALRPNAASLSGPTRGIRAIAPGTPAPTYQQSNGASQASAAPAATGGPPSLDLANQFESGSAVLTSGAMRELDRLGQALASSELAADKFRIEGHTDTVGTPEANKTLSEQRADAVASYLESKFGIQSDRLVTVGVGEADLAVPTPDQTPELRNRRVHIVNLSA